MEGSSGYIGGSLGFIVLLILLFACCCCGNRNLRVPHHTTPCEAHHEARLLSTRRNDQHVPDRICICPPGQGFNYNSPSPNNPTIPTMPGHEIPMDNRNGNGQGQSRRLEMGDEIRGEAAPPYSPPKEVKRPQQPQSALVRGQGASGDAVVWVEGTHNNNATPEVQRSTGWSRWAA